MIIVNRRIICMVGGRRFDQIDAVRSRRVGEQQPVTPGDRESKAFCALDEATLERLKMAMNEPRLSNLSTPFPHLPLPDNPN